MGPHVIAGYGKIETVHSQSVTCQHTLMGHCGWQIYGADNVMGTVTMAIVHSHASVLMYEYTGHTVPYVCMTLAFFSLTGFHPNRVWRQHVRAL